MIEFRDVRKTYVQGARRVVALDGVSLSIPRGSFASVMGPSGSGKSTLLHLAGGLDLPDGGEVLLDGRSTSAMDDDALTLLRRRRLGFVFQFFNLLPSLTVAENVALPLLLEGGSRPDAARRAAELLARVGLADRATHHPDELSGGEMQRTALARALAADPPLLLADEPTGNLDSATGRAILDLLRDVVRKDGRTLLMVTHDSAAAAFGDLVITLRDGRVESERRP